MVVVVEGGWMVMMSLPGCLVVSRVRVEAVGWLWVVQYSTVKVSPPCHRDPRRVDLHLP